MPFRIVNRLVAQEPMPGQLKEVRNRIKSVQSSQQITKAMKMVSAAKLRRAQDAIVQMRPYALKLQEVLHNIVSNSDADVDMALAAQRPVEKVLLVVITSDRGLCGGYNANLIKLAKQRIAKNYSGQFAKGQVTILPIGKKGHDHFAKLSYKTDNRFYLLFQHLSFEQAVNASSEIMRSYLAKEYDTVEIIYSQFRNAAMQRFEAEAFLPVAKKQSGTASDSPVREGKRRKADFIFEPDKSALISELMPKILNTQFYKALLDAHASEHGARMTAMDKATENAGEILKSLRLSYNRARQAAITTELTEIVSGSAALQG